MPAIIDSFSAKMVTSGAPTYPGSYITVFAVGLGDVRGGVAGTTVASGGPNSVVSPVTVQVGDTTLVADYAGLVPGYSGLYQINLRIPFAARGRAMRLRIHIGSAVSEPATLYVGPAAN